jgi:hypothetical protein
MVEVFRELRLYRCRAAALPACMCCRAFFRMEGRYCWPWRLQPAQVSSLLQQLQWRLVLQPRCRPLEWHPRCIAKRRCSLGKPFTPWHTWCGHDHYHGRHWVNLACACCADHQDAGRMELFVAICCNRRHWRRSVAQHLRRSCWLTMRCCQRGEQLPPHCGCAQR